MDEVEVVVADPIPLAIETLAEEKDIPLVVARGELRHGLRKQGFEALMAEQHPETRV